jgi:hypothetical protein
MSEQEINKKVIKTEANSDVHSAKRKRQTEQNKDMSEALAQSCSTFERDLTVFLNGK